jgi:mono/diheme cytochrome c family protein
MKQINCTNVLRATVVALIGPLSIVPLPALAGEQDGQLLYDTYCISCHTTQVHWRQNRLATDWLALKGQIDRWQTNIGQNWTRQQIDDVANYLNGQFYKFDPASESRTEQKPAVPASAPRAAFKQ